MVEIRHVNRGQMELQPLAIIEHRGVLGGFPRLSRRVSVRKANYSDIGAFLRRI